MQHKNYQRQHYFHTVIRMTLDVKNFYTEVDLFIAAISIIVTKLPQTELLPTKNPLPLSQQDYSRGF